MLCSTLWVSCSRRGSEGEAPASAILPTLLSTHKVVVQVCCRAACCGRAAACGLQDLTCRACSSRWCAWREVLSLALTSGLAEALQPGHARDICTCSVHQSHTGLSSQVRSCSTCGAHKHTTHAVPVGQGVMEVTSVRGHVWAWPYSACDRSALVGCSLCVGSPDGDVCK